MNEVFKSVSGAAVLLTFWCRNARAVYTFLCLVKNGTQTPTYNQYVQETCQDGGDVLPKQQQFENEFYLIVVCAKCAYSF